MSLPGHHKSLAGCMYEESWISYRGTQALSSSLSLLLPEDALGIGRAQHGSSHLTVPEEIGGHGEAGGHLSQRANQPLSRSQSGGHP